MSTVDGHCHSLDWDMGQDLPGARGRQEEHLKSLTKDLINIQFGCI